ncbi:MAG TPA: DUF1559 domain-containing protein [Pirellulales bacterium]|nr:DUF1559 domain-containing protein [Pirellulales bacterium]
MQRPARNAFTLVEVLIVIAIIGMLIAILLPAIQAARESARRRSCANNLAQLALAVAHYESVHATLPPGTIDAKGPITSRAVGYHMSWMAQILPYVEQPNAFRHLDFSVGAYAPKNLAVRQMVLHVLECPSSSAGFAPSGVGESHYAGCHHDVEAPIDADNHGVFHLNSFVGFDDILDGRAQTIFFGEKTFSLSNFQRTTGGDLGWLSGTRAMLRNTGTPINATSRPGGPLANMVSVGLIDLGPPPPDTGQQPPDPQDAPPVDRPVWGGPAGMRDPFNEFDRSEYQPSNVPAGVRPALVVGGFGSNHPLGAQFAFGDGSVRLLAEAIDAAVYRRMGNRADGELLDDR